NLYRRAVGDMVTLEVRRGDQTLKFPVAIAERPDDPLRFSDLVSPDRNIVPRLGVLALDINDRIAPMIGGLRLGRGVLVAARSADSPMADHGLRPGDVIVSMNGAPIAALADLRSGIGRLPAHAPGVLHVQPAGRLVSRASGVQPPRFDSC